MVELEHQLQRLSSDERKKNEQKIKAGPVDMTVRGWSQGRSGASNSGAIVSLSRTGSVSSPFQVRALDVRLGGLRYLNLYNVNVHTEICVVSMPLPAAQDSA